MKKALFLLIPLFLIFTTSCDNFMNGSDVQEQLNQMIDVATAKSCTLIVSQDNTMGSFLSAGDKTCKLGYSIEVQFTVKKDQYIYKGLKAVSKSDETKSMASYVEFTQTDGDDTRGVYKTSIKLLQESDDILIMPDCEPVPSIIEMTPGYEYEGKQQDTTITLKFNKPVTSVGEIEYLKTFLTITDSDGQSLAQYFGTPYFNDDSTILYIPTVKTQRLLTDADEKLDIVVKFDLSGIQDEFENIGNGFYQNKYRINGSLDSIKPTLSAVTTYTDKDKARQLLATPFETWPASSTDKTNYIQNHIKGSVYAELEGYDEDSGIARARVYEKLLKYSDGTTPDTILTLESSVEFLEQSDSGKYCILYDLKSNMDGIVELSFNLEDYAGNVNKSSEAKKVYVLKDTLVDSSSICFDQELTQLEVSEESWLSAIPEAEGNSQNIKLTIAPAALKDTFYTDCTSDYKIEAFWGYSKDAITNPITIDKAKGEYSFTRDVTKFVYIKLIVSDDIGNTSEIIKYMDPRPEFNNVAAQTLQDPHNNVELSLKGLDSIKLLANKKIAGSGGKGGDHENKTYTQFIFYIYDNVDSEGKPVCEPIKKINFETSWNSSSQTNEPSPYGNGLNNWRLNDENLFNKLIRVYAASLCGDFLSPLSSNYVEYIFSSFDDSWYPVYSEGKAPKLSNAGSSSSDINTSDMHYEYGPYIKNTVKIKSERVPDTGMYKITFDDYKTAAALEEGNVQYQFIAYERWLMQEISEDEEVTDEICGPGRDYRNNEEEFYLPAINYYKFYIVASGKQGTYISIDMTNQDYEIPVIGDEPGISFYLNGATTAIKLMGFSEDIMSPNVMIGPEYSDPFTFNSEPGSIKIGFAEDESGLYKNEKGNYELTYYLIPATGSRLQTNKTYTLEELEKNYKTYKRTIEYSMPETENGITPDIGNLSIPMGNEKGGVYNLVVVYEDIYHNANVVTYPCVNRLLGDFSFEQTPIEIIQHGYLDAAGYWHDLGDSESAPPDSNEITSAIYCQQLDFTLDDYDCVKIYKPSNMGGDQWEQLWTSNQSESNSYKVWNPYEMGQYQGQQGAPIRDQWFKICGYKKTESTFEMGFYNTQYYYLTDTPFIICNSKNAITGLNGIQIFFDNPILVHTMFFKDYIPDDIDKNDYKGWERRGAETGVVSAKPSTQVVNQFDPSGNYMGASTQIVPSTATYSFKDNYKDIPSGCYYTTIIHFADGDVIMSDIKYKE